MREDFNCNYVNNYEEDNELLPDSQEGENTDDGDQLTTTIELASSPLNSVLEEGEEKERKAECSSALADPLPSLPAAAAAAATTNDNNFSKIIIVQFDDAERSSFAIPLPATLSSSSSTSLTFEWLSAELCKRYYRKFSVKPVISLYTTEGAIISAEDLVVDMIRGIGGGKPVFKARIESYSTEDPAKRFRELCKEAGEVEVCEELAETLSSLRVSGCFNVADSFLGAVRQNQLMLQSLYRQEIKEIVRALVLVFGVVPFLFLPVLLFLAERLLLEPSPAPQDAGRPAHRPRLAALAAGAQPGGHRLSAPPTDQSARLQPQPAPARSELQRAGYCR